ncbi:hypothetical protein L596_019830 [Steinernema carpocapsae]|uniref:Uncharacterized protein n=1 Tax=Steinernema carpocapsae TaxID=34508 RepID=A0A4U5MSB0_STECR|nr:hypothetical protein L596_019830 [Steinernema carpocapsae]
MTSEQHQRSGPAQVPRSFHPRELTQWLAPKKLFLFLQFLSFAVILCCVSFLSCHSSAKLVSCVFYVINLFARLS